MSRPRIVKAKIKAAIPGSGGIILHICRKAGYASWHAVRDFIAADPELSQMLADERERVDDAAESALIHGILSGDRNDAKWWLANGRRWRQWGQKVDLTTGGAPIRFIEVVLGQQEKNEGEGGDGD